MKTETFNSALQRYFVTALQEMYWSETHLVNVLSTMTEAASELKLQQAFDEHRQQTEGHAESLRQVFALLALEPQAEPCAGLQGIFDEGWQVIDESEPGSAQRDVALIIAAQKVEHYEIASYGSLVTLAKTLDQPEIASILGKVLEEEKQADSILTSLAEGGINAEAGEEALASGS